MEPKDKVLRVMREKAVPMRTSDIMEAAGMDKNSVEKAMKLLKAEETIYSPVRCMWQAK